MVEMYVKVYYTDSFFLYVMHVCIWTRRTYKSFIVKKKKEMY